MFSKACVSLKVSRMVADRETPVMLIQAQCSSVLKFKWIHFTICNQGKHILYVLKRNIKIILQSNRNAFLRGKIYSSVSFPSAFLYCGVKASSYLDVCPMSWCDETYSLIRKWKAFVQTNKQTKKGVLLKLMALQCLNLYREGSGANFGWKGRCVQVHICYIFGPLTSYPFYSTTVFYPHS